MSDNYLIHYGIIGQKWGIRNYQNPDGTLTEAGRQRYSNDYEKHRNKIDGAYKKSTTSEKIMSAKMEIDKNKQYRNAGNVIRTAATAVSFILGGPLGGIEAGTINSVFSMRDAYRRDKFDILMRTYISDLEKTMKES